MLSERFRGRSIWHSYDWKIIICYLLIMLIGWVCIYASVHSSNPKSIFDFSLNCGKQFIWIVTALGIGATILFLLPARLWESISIPLYLLVAVLLVAVIFLGKATNGSMSWFSLGPIKFQPAEVSKLSTSLLLAYIMSRSGFKLDSTKDFLLVAGTILLPMGIIVLEKETGSALVYVGLIFMLYREGLTGWLIMLGGMAILLFITTLMASPFTSMLMLIGIISFCNELNAHKIWRWFCIWLPLIAIFAVLPLFFGVVGEEDETLSLMQKIKPIYILVVSFALSLPYFLYRAWRKRRNFLFASLGAALAGIALIFFVDYFFNNVLKGYQRDRIEVLLGMKEDIKGAGYNVHQSIVAIGSGELTGNGFLKGTQTAYGFVPEQSTDFIFCTLGEEWGLLGCMTVIILYALLIFWIVKDAEASRESFTRIYGYCVACCIFMHLIINIGMTIGIMPVIGIPLPMMSYGGSSLWSFTAMIFIFLVLDHQEKKYF